MNHEDIISFCENIMIIILLFIHAELLNNLVYKAEVIKKTNFILPFVFVLLHTVGTINIDGILLSIIMVTIVQNMLTF